MVHRLQNRRRSHTCQGRRRISIRQFQHELAHLGKSVTIQRLWRHAVKIRIRKKQLKSPRLDSPLARQRPTFVIRRAKALIA